MLAAESHARRALPMGLPMAILRNVRIAGNQAQLERRLRR
jgi:hypothetical protein